MSDLTQTIQIKVEVHGINRVHAMIHVMMKLKILFYIPVFLFGHISVTRWVSRLVMKLITVKAVEN